MATTYEGFVYFVQCPANGLIKIGVADDPARRFRDLSCQSPFPLVMLGTLPGGRSFESRMHGRFCHLRHHGEWFLPGERLLYLIDRWSRPLGHWLSRLPEPPATPEEAWQRMNAKAIAAGFRSPAEVPFGFFSHPGKFYGVLKIARSAEESRSKSA
jgi:hypothetical protein